VGLVRGGTEADRRRRDREREWGRRDLLVLRMIVSLVEIERLLRCLVEPLMVEGGQWEVRGPQRKRTADWSVLVESGSGRAVMGEMRATARVKEERSNMSCAGGSKASEEKEGERKTSGGGGDARSRRVVTKGESEQREFAPAYASNVTLE
jgi:hypothetical protein